tara:strand:+ start:2298 stop:2912 length:615 start_codon:yes stop_codon:yes gene_type:complete
MFNTHCKAVQEYSQRNANNMADTVLMVVLSIQQNWLGVGEQLADVRANKKDSKYLWGNKIKTYDYLMSNKSKMFAQIQAVLNSNKSYDDKAYSLMIIFLRVDGLGVPKAGFCCQLIAGMVGCMDLHNIKMYKLDVNSFKLNPKPKTDKANKQNIERIKNYIHLCHDYGCEQLWDSWCDNLATKSKRWQDGNHVSEVHYTYLTGE